MATDSRARPCRCRAVGDYNPPGDPFDAIAHHIRCAKVQGTLGSKVGTPWYNRLGRFIACFSSRPEHQGFCANYWVDKRIEVSQDDDGNVVGVQLVVYPEEMAEWLRECGYTVAGPEVDPQVTHNHFDVYDLRCPQCGHVETYLFTDEFHEYDGYKCGCGATWRFKGHRPKEQC